MNREIKFRAYNKNTHVWADWESIHRLHDYIELPAWELMQFTGLTDKNGKEIYEGDIVTHNIYTKASGRTEKSEPNAVYWNEETCGFETNKEGSYRAGMFYEEYEVIGNIYENPELL